MAIYSFNDSQKLDYLWKKVGYGVAKTAEQTSKEAFNESIPSPLLYRGDLVWVESVNIPSTPPVATTSIVKVYKDGGGAGYSPTVECTEDLTAPDNQTWKTNLTNWVPTQFGDNYLVTVYIANSGVTNPQTVGTKLFQAGSGTNDTWFFDYQAGVLNFNGSAIPAQIAAGVTGKSIYIVGYRYVGLLGVTTLPNGTTIGNLSFSNANISSINANANINLTPNGAGIVKSSADVYAPTFYGNIVGNISGNITIGGANTQVIFNDDGTANGNNSLTFNKTTSLLTLSGNSNVTGNSTVGGNLSVAGNSTLGNTATANYFVGNGALLTGVGNATAILNGNSNITIPSANGNINMSVGGNSNVIVVTGTGANITGTANISGNLTANSLNTSNGVSATGNVTGGNVNSNGIVSASGKINSGNAIVAFNGQDGQVAIGGTSTDGVISIGKLGRTDSGTTLIDFYSTGNSQVQDYDVRFKVSGGSQFANASGNLDIYAAKTTFSGDVTLPHDTTAGNIFVNRIYANYANATAIEGSSLSIVGNTTSGNVYANGGTIGATTLIGTLTTNAQPNITSVGTLASLDVTGNITAGNADLGNLVTGNYVTGTLTTNAQPNITSIGALTSLTVTSTIVGSVTGSASTVTANAQPNITSVGTLNSLAVTGNTTAGNVYANSGTVSAVTLTGTLTTANQPNITSVGTLNNLAVTGNVIASGLLQTSSGLTGQTSVGIDATNGGIQIGKPGRSNTVGGTPFIDFYSTAGNATFPPDVRMIVSGGINGGVSGSGTGVLSISGAAANFKGNIGSLGNITGANIYANSGTVGASLLTGTLTTNTQPNVTSVGTLGNLTVTSNILAGNVYANLGTVVASKLTGTLTTNIQPNITSVGTLTSLDVAGNINSGNAILGNLASANYLVGTLVTLAQPNITSVGTLTSLDVSGNSNVVGNNNVTGNTISGNVYANSGTVRALNLTGTLTTNAQPNVTSVGTLTSLNATGNISGAYFIGNGSQLTGLNTSSISNGNSNVRIATSNGNVTITSAGNTTMTITGTGANVTGTANVTGNLVAANANLGNTVRANYFTGTLTTTAQPNVTSVGTLTSLSVAGNITASNVTSNNNVIASGLLQASPGLNGQTTIGLDTNNGGIQLGKPGRGNTFGGTPTIDFYSSAGNATFPPDVRMIVSGGDNGGVDGSGTGILNISGAEANFKGNIGSLGNITGANIYANSGTVGASLLTGTLTTNAQPNITSVGTLTGLNVVGNVDVVGYVSAIKFVSNDAALGNIAGTLTTNAQPNITSVGTLTSLSVADNISSGNVYANSGTVGASKLAGSLTTASQPNITSVGTLTSLAVTGNVNMNGNWLTNVAYAVTDTDAASKAYVDTMVSTGISYHQPVNAATTTTLATATSGTTTYISSSGSANGIGAYIRTTGTYTLIDGVNIATVGARILVKNEANSTWNGVYTYANSTAIVRSTDTDEYGPDSSQALSINDYFFTLAGTVNEGVSFIVSAPSGTITFGTSNITFSTFSTSQIYDAGTGISVTGTVISANAIQTQITSVGTLSNLTVTGNVLTSGVLQVSPGLNGQTTIGLDTNNGGIQLGKPGRNNTFAGTPVIDFYSSAGNATFPPDVRMIVSGGDNGGVNGSGTGVLSISGAAANFKGNIGSLGNITAANIYANSGTVGANLLTGTLTTNEQPNITSVGTLTILTVSSNVYANRVAADKLTGTLTTNLQPNITSVGTLTTLRVTGNITAGNIVSNNSITSSNANLGNVNVTGTLSTTGNISAGNVSVGDLLSTNSFSANYVVASLIPNANITYDLGSSTNAWRDLYLAGNTIYLGNSSISAGTITNGNSKISIPTTNGNVMISASNANVMLITSEGANITGTLNATGNVSSGNASLGNRASANYLIGNLLTSSQPNITGVGTLTSLNVSGVINSLGQLTLTRIGNLSTGNAQLFLNGTGNNRIEFNNQGMSEPTVGNTRSSSGTKITLYPSVEANTTDYAIGINAGTLWNSVPKANSDQSFKWYGGNTSVASLDGTGNLSAIGNITGGNLSTAGTITANGGAYGEVVTTPFASVWGSGGGPNPYSIMQVRSSDGVSGLGMQAYTGSGMLYGNTAITFALARIRDKEIPLNVVSKAYIDSTGFIANGIVSASGNVTGGNLITAGNVTATGNINSSNTLIAFSGLDGQIIVGENSTHGSIEIGKQGRANAGTPYIDFHSAANSTDYDVRFYVSGGSNSAAGQGNLNIGAYNIETGGNFYANNGTVGALKLTGSLTTAAQPNITSVGTLTSLNVSGNINSLGQLTLTRAGNLSTGNAQLFLNGTGNNRIEFNNQGVSAPTVGNTRSSSGTKITLYSSSDANTTDYAIGISAGTLWNSVPAAFTTYYFKWYGGNTNIASLDGTGNLSAIGNITGGNLKTTGAVFSSNLAVTGNATINDLTVTGNTNVTNNLIANNISTPGNLECNKLLSNIGYVYGPLSVDYLITNVTSSQNEQGQCRVGGTDDGTIEIGRLGRTTTGSPYIDFHSSSIADEYDVRMQVNSGTVTSNVTTNGFGALTISAKELVIDGPAGDSATIKIGSTGTGNVGQLNKITSNRISVFNNSSTYTPTTTLTVETDGLVVAPWFMTRTMLASELPIASDAYTGMRAFIINAPNTNFNQIITQASTGTNKVPVWCNGVSWRIG